MGQLREWDNFTKQISICNEFVKEGLISELIFVTDNCVVGEDERIYLKMHGVRLLEKEPLDDAYLMTFDPEIKSRTEKLRMVSGGVRSGTIWRQLYDLDFALNSINGDCRILRSRTDILLNSSLIRKILTSSERKINKNTGYGVFEEKIWVQWFSLHTPFYIHDTAFYGNISDIRKLVSPNINVEISKFYPTASLPIFFWVYPFYKKFDWVEDWLTRFAGTSYSPVLMNDPHYVKLLIEYYKCIQNNFWVNYGGVEWMLQWNPGVYEKKIWGSANIDKSIVDNLLSATTSQQAVETDSYLVKGIEGFIAFYDKSRYSNISFIIRVRYIAVKKYFVKLLGIKL